MFPSRSALPPLCFPVVSFQHFPLLLLPSILWTVLAFPLTSHPGKPSAQVGHAVRYFVIQCVYWGNSTVKCGNDTVKLMEAVGDTRGGFTRCPRDQAPVFDWKQHQDLLKSLTQHTWCMVKNRNQMFVPVLVSTALMELTVILLLGWMNLPSVTSRCSWLWLVWGFCGSLTEMWQKSDAAAMNILNSETQMILGQESKTFYHSCFMGTHQMLAQLACWVNWKKYQGRMH